MAVTLKIRGTEAQAARPDVEVSTEAARMARELGMGGDVRARLVRMVARSVPWTSELGNRRFDQFIMQVTGGRVESIDRL